MRKTQEDSFCKFLATEREKANLTMNDLCRGIYTSGMIRRIESGERKADKMMQDRLLARLGISSDIYENYLSIDEYELWKIRQKILKAVDNQEIETSKKYLEQYRERIKGNRIGEQFYLVMKAELLKQEGAEEKEIAQITETAVKLTVPDIEKTKLKNLILSVQELNLVLEYKKYCHPQTFGKDCEELFDYVEERQMDEMTQAKILPKIIYEKWKFMRQKENTQEELIGLLKLCNHGIELDRATGRLFYFWELLQMRLWCMEKLTEIWKQHGWEKKRQSFGKMMQKTKEWMDVLEELYEEHELSKEMQSCCYLYWQQETYCVNDVIRIRREMLGMTRQELYEGICSEKTLGRIERKQCKPQLEIIKGLFERLHLSGEMRRPRVAAEGRESIEYEKKIRKTINNKENEKAIGIIEEARKYISEKEVVNRQCLEESIEISRWNAGQISKKEYITDLKNIMGYTLPYEEMFGKKEYFVTREEQQLFYNIALAEKEEKKYELLKILADLYEGKKEADVPNSQIAMYELILTAFASTLGNLGRYEESNNLSHKVIKESLSHRRMYIDANLHCIAWNQKKCLRDDRGKESCEVEQKLRKCICIAQLNKKSFYENYYRKERKDYVKEMDFQEINCSMIS